MSHLSNLILFELGFTFPLADKIQAADWTQLLISKTSTHKELPPIMFVLCVFLFASLKINANPCITASTCTECVKASKDCGFCTDPQFNGSVRCDLKTNLESKCSSQHIYEPKTELRVPKQHQNDGQTITQLEPQQVQVKIKPGDSIEVPFRYEHRKNAGIEVQNFQIMTSSYKNTGVEVEFFIDCNGERRSGTLCPGIQDGQRVNFYVKLTLVECKSVALSVSVYGYNTVSAVFVTPLCECECEKPQFYERRAAACRYQGDLRCGKCECDGGRGGRSCECELSHHGVNNAEQLDDKCRPEPGAPICSANGICNCGRCVCTSGQGEFCKGDEDTSCPTDSNGKLCFGHGECYYGKCRCEEGFEGPDCACSEDKTQCTENGLICSGNGQCNCNVCSCQVGFTGVTCAIEQASSEWNQQTSDGEILPSDDEHEPDSHHQHGEKAAGMALLPSVMSLMTLLAGVQLFNRF
ncbi:putative integrin beta-like protein C05D9.3 [Aphelenchoides bicaudatus]|nr:putative integrin beta-like protein C05D9.3 [Aphelenchoides bicaudatus]